MTHIIARLFQRTDTGYRKISKAKAKKIMKKEIMEDDGDEDNE